MPARDVLTAFTEEASRRMVDAVQPYYDAVDAFGADSQEARSALAQARFDLERAVRMNHVDAAVIGGGGNVSPEGMSVLQDIVGTDTYYVERFADDLPRLSRAQALVRADMYVSTQRNTITDITSLELPTLPVYPKDRQLECGHFCTCTLDIRFLFGNGNFDVYWNLDAQVKEACPDCVRLAASWRPLKIRAGKIGGQKMIDPADVEHIRRALAKVAA